jgi:uncharacterized protein (DUF1330 family)
MAAYWIARLDVHNMDGYQEYIAQNGAVFKKYGARFLVRGGKFESKEGASATIHLNIPGWSRSARPIPKATS